MRWLLQVFVLALYQNRDYASAHTPNSSYLVCYSSLRDACLL
jgi:hypothetical protein